MKKMQDWLDEYGVSHQNKINKALHWICVPTIFFTIFGLLSTIPIHALGISGLNDSYFHVGSIILALVLVYYIVLSRPMFVGMFLFSIVVIELNMRLAMMIDFNYTIFNLIVFALAWIGQFIGHHIEGKKPSFIKDVQFLLIGPAWLMAFIYKKLGLQY